MTLGTHMLAAVVASLALNLPLIPALLGALLPDLDLKKGLPFPPKRTLFNAHRGITHHLLWLPVLFMASLWVKDFINHTLGVWLLSFTVGFATHLFLDALTPLGIPYKHTYYPRLSLKLFKTGKLGELFVILILLFVLLYQVQHENLNYLEILGLGGLNEVLH
jgi:inner membrane protein